MLSYRAVIVALLAAITFYFTGNAGEATAITIVFNVGGSLVYYGYERLWDSISWGKKTQGDVDATLKARLVLRRPPEALRHPVATDAGSHDENSDELDESSNPLRFRATAVTKDRPRASDLG